MTVEQLRELYESMPPGASVNLPRQALAELLEGIEHPHPESEPIRDFTLEEVAEQVGRAVSTVRGWCSQGLITGAYKLNGRSWRVPSTSLRLFKAQQVGAPVKRAERADLSSWRSLRATP